MASMHQSCAESQTCLPQVLCILQKHGWVHDHHFEHRDEGTQAVPCLLGVLLLFCLQQPWRLSFRHLPQLHMYIVKACMCLQLPKDLQGNSINSF